MRFRPWGGGGGGEFFRDRALELSQYLPQSVTIFIYKKLILVFIKYLKFTLKLYSQLYNPFASFWFG